VGEILQAMGIQEIGAPGSTAAVALLNDAVKKGGLFASSSVGGMSGAFIPVAEDSALAHAAAEGTLSIEKLEAMTSVCSVGLDMVCIPGDTDADTISALIADEMAIGVINHKTTATRLIPVPGKNRGNGFTGADSSGPLPSWRFAPPAHPADLFSAAAAYPHRFIPLRTERAMEPINPARAQTSFGV
jgi:uncharacterized protein (UPF0210 family)